MKATIAITYWGVFPEVHIDGKILAKRGEHPVTVPALVAVELVTRGDFKVTNEDDANDIANFLIELNNQKIEILDPVEIVETVETVEKPATE